MSNLAGADRYAGVLVGGRYRLERLLGEGGMGVVYAAHLENRPTERFAVKMLHEEMSQNPMVVERFLGEGDVCLRMNHPGVLRIFEVGHEKGVPFLVMELLHGRALVEYTEHLQRLPLNFAVTVCAGVLDALDYAHSLGIVHRDLKPENVFLVGTPQGSYRTKLLDFGIARCIDAAGGGRRRTATGVLLGTPGYMSPEQVKAARHADHRTDLWAVGVMFYEMVAGALAFPADGEDQSNVWALLSAVLIKEPVPLSRIDPHLAPFDGFIRRALAKDPDQRFGSAREMSEAMLRIARGEVAFGATAALGQTALAPPPSIVGTVVAPVRQEGAFTREQRVVPIHSQGEIVALPPLESTVLLGQAAQPSYGVPSAPVYRTPPPPPPALAPPQSSMLGMATVPLTDNHTAMAFGAPPSVAGNQPVQPSGFGQTVRVSAPLVPNLGVVSAPSPLSPPPPQPSVPLPVVDNAGDVDEPARGAVLPWILLGVALLGALVGAFLWLQP